MSETVSISFDVQFPQVVYLHLLDKNILWGGWSISNVDAS